MLHKTLRVAPHIVVLMLKVKNKETAAGATARVTESTAQEGRSIQSEAPPRIGAIVGANQRQSIASLIGTVIKRYPSTGT